MTQPIPIYYREKIKAIPGVRDLAVWQWFGGTFKDARDTNNFFPRFATEPDHIFNVHPEYQIPEDQQLAFRRERTGCIVSRVLADKMNFKLGDRITLVGDIFPVTLDLKVVGIFDEPEHGQVLYFNREYLRESIGATKASSDQVGAFLIQAASGEDVPLSAERVGRGLDN